MAVKKGDIITWDKKRHYKIIDFPREQLGQVQLVSHDGGLSYIEDGFIYNEPQTNIEKAIMIKCKQLNRKTISWL